MIWEELYITEKFSGDIFQRTEYTYVEGNMKQSWVGGGGQPWNAKALLQLGTSTSGNP